MRHQAPPPPDSKFSLPKSPSPAVNQAGPVLRFKLRSDVLTRFIDFLPSLIYTQPHSGRRREVKYMALSDETLQAMIRDFHGFPLSEAEVELIRPELDQYLAELDKLRDLDLSSVMSSRILRVDEGGDAHG